MVSSRKRALFIKALPVVVFLAVACSLGCLRLFTAVKLSGASADPGQGSDSGRDSEMSSDASACNEQRSREKIGGVLDLGEGCSEQKAVQQRDLSEERSFLELARARFEKRVGRWITKEDEKSTFDHIQLVRVPKAASTAASMVARALAGCSPPGPCCEWPGDPAGSCPSKGLMCNDKVTGCSGHHMNALTLAMERDPKVFSMSNMRDVKDRIVSAFFYTAPHSPACARRDTVNYKVCFRAMVNSPRYQNVASRMLVGHYAYDGKKKICMTPGRGCVANLRTVIRSACDLNFIALSEAWGTSMLLLFETVPWIAPTEEYMPTSHGSEASRKSRPHLEIHPIAWDADYVPHWNRGHRRIDAEFDSMGEFNGRTLAEDVTTRDVTRHNTGKRHEEGIGHITTPELTNLALKRNAVDVQLHLFISAMFCLRLNISGLVKHPLVVEELKSLKSLDDMCSNISLMKTTLEGLGPLRATKGGQCRLYRPLNRQNFV